MKTTSYFGSLIPSVIRVTAFVPSHQASRLGSWTTGENTAWNEVTVSEEFNEESHDEARDHMIRLIVSFGATIKRMESKRIYPA